MIIARITGGLGNQLFQYAFSRSLAIRSHTELKLDISEYNSWKLRKFELDMFNIKLEIASQKEIKSFLKFSSYFPKVVQLTLHRYLKVFFPDILYEKHFHFDKTFLKPLKNAYVIGFWQSEKYFSDIEGIIRKEFTLKDPLSKKGSLLLKKFQSCESVAINFRRGEFVTDPDIRRRHGVLGLDYYKKAVSFITKRIKNPHFFIFSDEIDWVKRNFRLTHATIYVDFNYPNKVYEDLILGSCCKYNIIANSTFSWWVAWLNNNPSKIVIAPKKWFDLAPYVTSDLIPKSWIRL